VVLVWGIEKGLKLYKEEKNIRKGCGSERVSEEYFYLKYMLCCRGYDYEMIWNILCTLDTMLDQDHKSLNDLSLHDLM